MRVLRTLPRALVDQFIVLLIHPWALAALRLDLAHGLILLDGQALWVACNLDWSLVSDDNDFW